MNRLLGHKLFESNKSLHTQKSHLKWSSIWKKNNLISNLCNKNCVFFLLSTVNETIVDPEINTIDSDNTTIVKGKCQTHLQWSHSNITHGRLIYLYADEANNTIVHEPTKVMMNVNIRNANFQTPLHLAAYNGATVKLQFNHLLSMNIVYISFIKLQEVRKLQNY